MSRPKLSLHSLMLAIAVISVGLAASRIGHVAVIVAGVLLLAWKRTSDGIAGGLATRPSRKAGLLLSSFDVAAVLFGLSALTFTLGYYGALRWAYETVVMSHWTPDWDLDYVLTGVIVGCLASLSVAVPLGETIWPIKGAPPEHRTRPIASHIRRAGTILAASCVAGVVLPAQLEATLPDVGLRDLDEVVYGAAVAAWSWFLPVAVGHWADRRPSRAADRRAAPGRLQSRPSSQLTPRPRS